MKNPYCPNVSIPAIKEEFEKLKKHLGEDLAYWAWFKNKGYALTHYSNGEENPMHKTLVDTYGEKRADELMVKALKSGHEWATPPKAKDVVPPNEVVKEEGKEPVREEVKEPLTLVAKNAFLNSIAQGKFGVKSVKELINAMPERNSAMQMMSDLLDNIDTKKLEQTRKDILNGKREISNQKQVEMAVDLALLTSKGKELEVKKQEAIDNGTSEKELQEIDREIIDNENDQKDSLIAGKLLGKEWGELGQFRRTLNAIRDEYNIVDMEAEYRAKDNIKGDLTPEQAEYLKNEHKGIKDAQANIEKVKKAEAEAKEAKEKAEHQQSMIDEMDAIIEKYKKQVELSKENTETHRLRSQSKIDSAKKKLKMLTYGRASAMGILDPQIYVAYKDIISGKIEQFYDKTKGKIELKKLLSESLKEAREIMPETTAQDIEDALSGNYKKPKVTKNELTGIKEELKKELLIRRKYPKLFDENDKGIEDLESKIKDTKAKGKLSQTEAEKLKENERQLQKLKDIREGKLPEKGIAKEDRPIIKRLKELQKEELKKQKEPLKQGEWNKKRVKDVYRQIQKVNDDVKNKRYENPEREVFKKSKELQSAERLLEQRKAKWRTDRKTAMMKQRPLVEKIIDTWVDTIRASNLLFGGTIIKLTGVVGQSLTTKLPRTLIQIGVNKLLPKEISKYGGYWGDTELKNVSKYYVDHVKMFSFETLKKVYGKEGSSDPTQELHGSLSNPKLKFLNIPGKTHQLIKEFIKTPEFNFSLNTQIYNALKNLNEADVMLKNKDITSKEREKWQEQYDMFDVSDENVMSRINEKAMADANYQILMNNAKLGGKIKNAFGGTSKNPFIRIAQKVLWKSQNTIVTVPINYFSRYLYTKYGALAQSLTGSFWRGGGNERVPGLPEVFYKQLFGKDAFENSKMSPEVKEQIVKNSVNGGYTAMAMGIAALTYKLITYDRDKKQYIIDGVPVTEKILHYPLMDTYLSYATTFNDISQISGDAMTNDYILKSLHNDYRQFKNMPFYNQLTYGYAGNVLDMIKLLARGKVDLAQQQGTEAVGKVISTFTAPPGFVREYAKQIDERLQEGEFLAPKTISEMIKKDYPWLSWDVPTSAEYEAQKAVDNERKIKPPKTIQQQIEADKKATKKRILEDKLRRK